LPSVSEVHDGAKTVVRFAIEGKWLGLAWPLERGLELMKTH